MKEFARDVMVLAAILLLSGIVTSCTKKSVPVNTGISTGTVSSTGGGIAGLDQEKLKKLGLTTPAEQQEFIARAKRFENEDIHFDFDSYLLSDAAKRILDEKILFMRDYPGVRAIIEGHCDERGTTEYNLALGERRAKSAWQYVVNSGISPDSLSTISYGEERPLVQGHNEEAWAQNRRVHFKLEF